jgi:hypothetical protein
MDRARLRTILPFVVAFLFLALAMSRAPQRALWIALAVIFILVGIRRRRSRPPIS